MATCTDYSKFSIPPGITPSGTHVVVINSAGEHKILENPAAAGLLYFNGTTFQWATGEEGNRINLPELKENDHTAVLAGFMGIGGDGGLQKVANPTGMELTLLSKDGILYWGTGVQGQGLPSDGFGILTKGGSGDAAWVSAPGIPVIDAASLLPITVPFGEPGDVLKMVGDTPEFVSPTVGAFAGVDTNDISAVRAKSTSATTISLQASSFKITNGDSSLDGQIAMWNLDLTYDITLSDSFDAGSEEANKWYYLYVIGALLEAPKLMASLDPTMPALPTGFTHWGLAGVFRNDAASDIVPFIQNGRTFHIVPQVVASNMTVTATLVAMGGPLTDKIPPSAKSVSGLIASSDATSIPPIAVASDVNYLGMQFCYSPDTTGHINGFFHGKSDFTDLAISDPSDPTFYWRTSGTLTTKVKLAITGYKV